MKSALLLLLICGISFASILHAEGNCPPGYFPTTPQGTQGPQGCAPIPNYDQNSNQQEAGPRWLSRWGAIATGTSHDMFGASSGMPSASSAKRKALRECKKKGGSKCEINVAYSNGCGAIIVSDEYFYVLSDATEKKAIQKGIQSCNADNEPNCHVYYTTCSPPLQIQ